LAYISVIVVVNHNHRSLNRSTQLVRSLILVIFVNIVHSSLPARKQTVAWIEAGFPSNANYATLAMNARNVRNRAKKTKTEAFVRTSLASRPLRP